MTMSREQRRALAKKVAQLRVAKMTDEERQNFARVGGLARGKQQQAEKAERDAKSSGDPKRYFSGPAPSAESVSEFLPAVLAENPQWRAGEDRTLREAGRRLTVFLLSGDKP